MSIETIENAIIAAIDQHQSRTVKDYQLCINERLPGPRPTGPFASYLTLVNELQDYPGKIYTGDPTETISHDAYIQSRIKFVGRDAVSRLTDFCIALHSANRWKDLYAVVGLGGIEAVQNISVIDDNGRMLEQATVNIMWYAELTASEEIDAISSGDIQIITNSETKTIEIKAEQ